MAIDPGRDKCGVIVIDENFEIKYQRVIDTSQLKKICAELNQKFKLRKIILGDGTTSKSAKKIISDSMAVEIKIVDEKHTTEEARKLYWEKNPPKGWRKFLPTSMQVPPIPVDDLVAEILAKKYLESERNE